MNLIQGWTFPLSGEEGMLSGCFPTTPSPIQAGMSPNSYDLLKNMGSARIMTIMEHVMVKRTWRSENKPIVHYGTVLPKSGVSAGLQQNLCKT